MYIHLKTVVILLVDMSRRFDSMSSIEHLINSIVTYDADETAEVQTNIHNVVLFSCIYVVIFCTHQAHIADLDELKQRLRTE